jgi:hypothetical protein
MNWFSASDDSLLALFLPVQLIGQVFINFPPMADRKNPDHPGFTVQLVSNAEPSDPDPPESGQLSEKRQTGEWIRA